MPLGIYISVPFCRTKCTYCNFASDVFSSVVFDRYVERVCEDIAGAKALSSGFNANVELEVDSIYLGGGTPTLLSAGQLERIFASLRNEFAVARKAEITVECAPGTLDEKLVETLLRCGVNRVSLGVQSFVDAEASAVGRLHTRAVVFEDIARLRRNGIANVNVDLIAGLPHQTRESWSFSLNETIASGVPHVSVYMLEVDEDSRLGRELLAGGHRYHAHFVPDEDATADFYVEACERLCSEDIVQYEISNFAREDFQSRHNLKYWQRRPYLGFGVDAHSMLLSRSPEFEAIRFASDDSLGGYLRAKTPPVSIISRIAALEETLFLGLRLTAGVCLHDLSAKFDRDLLEHIRPKLNMCIDAGLIEKTGDGIRLTANGRLLSNEVFERFLLAESIAS